MTGREHDPEEPTRAEPITPQNTANAPRSWGDRQRNTADDIDQATERRVSTRVSKRAGPPRM